MLSKTTNVDSDPLVIDPTMNCLAVLIRTRPTISNKILATVLNYNPLKSAIHPMTLRTVITVRSLERTTRALLRFIIRWNPHHPMAPKIDAYLQRLQASKTAVFQGAQNLKRPAEPTDGLDDAKRQRLQPPRRFPPMPPPPHSFAQLFTLTEDASLTQFDVKVLPEEMVSMISSALMQHIDSKSLDEAIEEVRQRYQMVQDAAKPVIPAAFPTSGDDDDDYDPELLSGPEHAATSISQGVGADLPQPMPELGPFELPKPPPLSSAELAVLSEQTVAHVFETALSSERNLSVSNQKLGINRLAASANDKDSWLTLMIRLATRAPAGLEMLVQSQTNGDMLKLELDDSQLASLQQINVPNRIRQLLFDYVLDDWHHRLPLGITWLTEEWYADKIEPLAFSNGDVPMTKADPRTPNYDYWSALLFDTLIPRFDANDHKILIRFVSELPSINRGILSQLKTLTRDPATVKICMMALQYLYLMRPPVREMVIDTMQEIWEDGDNEVKNTSGKILKKWRPGFVDRAVEKTKEEAESTRTFPNGVKVEQIASE